MSDTAARRADIDAKMEVVAAVLKEVSCEAAILLVPAHIAWFTGGMSQRGLYAEAERPGVYTNGRTRWLVCGNADTQRLFDEELDGLGFMLKEWPWAGGRAQLLGDLVAGKKVASDRPFPNMPLLVDRLRPELRHLYPTDRERLWHLGRVVSHALEATARGMAQGDTEQEVAGQLAHRVLHHGAEVLSISVAADDRGVKFRRSGYTDATVERRCTLQLTAVRHGLHVTASRTVCFGPPDDPFKAAFEAACKLAAVFRSVTKPAASVTTAVESGYQLLKNTPFEHEWRLSAAGYGTGWVPADELRKAGQDEPFVDRQPIVWQPRVSAAAIVDTVVVGPYGADAVTVPDGWPFKRISIAGRTYDIPDVLVR
jgi:Xaa-Pro aminopeptidase